MADKFYITTSIPYVNAPPHIGFALELVQADVLARYHRGLGDETYFLTGTDEHGLKIQKTAKEKDLEVKEFADLISSEFEKLTKVLNVSNNDFIQTTDQIRHWPSAIKIWNQLLQNEELYKKKYKGLYCVGHEAFLKKNDLISGLCPIHQTQPEEIEEENWFLKITKYKDKIKNKITDDELRIVPESRKNEILNLLDDAEDVSVSRPLKSLKWGISVPNDQTQIMYVWIDALTNYISALGYAENDEKFQKFWPADIHLIGKDIVRFHAIIWPTILLAVGLSLPKSIYVHGFINVGGQKMSKTIGNVIDPFPLVKKYGTEPIRYFLLREFPSYEDGNFSFEKLEARYNGDLANNLGNLISRVAKLIETKLNGELIFNPKFRDTNVTQKVNETKNKYQESIAQFKLHESLASVWELLTFANGYLDDKKPWAESNPEHLLKTLTNVIEIIFNGTKLIEPFLPETASKICQQFGFKTSDTRTDSHTMKVTEIKPLFPRI